MEKLASRLRWERNPNGIRAEIPARSSPGDVFLLALLGGWTALAIVYRRAVLPGADASWFAWVNVAVGLAGVILVSAALLWSFTGKTILCINAFQLTLERRVAGMEWDSRTFRVNEVHGLRYIAPSALYRFGDSDRYPSKIELTVNKKKVRFARGITEREASALLKRMREIATIANGP